MLQGAAPAKAFEWTLPAGFQRLTLKSNGEEVREFNGALVQVLWLGGPIGPFALHFGGGWAYERDRDTGIGLNFAMARASFDYELPLGGLVPYIGVEGMGWYPVNEQPFFKGYPLFAAPHVGVRFSLFDVVTLEVSAFGYPWGNNTWNVNDEAGTPYTGQAWGAGGAVSLTL